jgi:hypothetical protein
MSQLSFILSKQMLALAVARQAHKDAYEKGKAAWHRGASSRTQAKRRWKKRRATGYA